MSHQQKIILHVTESFGTGVLAVIQQLTNGLAGKDFDIHVAYSKRKETPIDFMQGFHSSIHFHELFLARNLDIVKDFRGIWSIFYLIKTLKPNIVHLHSSKAGFIGRIALFLCRLTGSRLRVFHSPHGLPFLQMSQNKYKILLYRTLEQVAHALGGVVVACSVGELNAFRKSVGRNRTLLIENAVDEKSIHRKEKSTTRKLTIATVGRISSQKNPELFKRIADRLGCDLVHFVWIGTSAEGSQQQELQLQNSVEVTGWLAKQDVLARLQKCDIYLQVSLWEGMPISVIEAMFTGLPTVVTDVIGNRDVVYDGVTGFVCKSENQLIEKLEKLIESEKLRARFGDEARTVAMKRFNIDRFIYDWCRAYRGEAWDVEANCVQKRDLMSKTNSVL